MELGPALPDDDRPGVNLTPRYCGLLSLPFLELPTPFL